MPEIREVTITIDGKSVVLRIPVETGETLDEFDNPPQEHAQAEWVGEDDYHIEANADEPIDTDSEQDPQDYELGATTIDLGAVNLQFDPPDIDAKGASDVSHGLHFAEDDDYSSTETNVVDEEEDVLDDIAFPEVSFDFEDAEPEDEDTPSAPQMPIDETVRDKPIAPPDNTRVVQATNVPEPDLDINALESEMVDFGDIEADDIDAIYERASELAMQAESVSAVPETHPPGLILRDQHITNVREEPTPILDSVTGELDDTPEFIPADDDEEPDSPEAIERRRQRRKGGLQAIGMILGGLVFAGGLGYLFIQESSSASSPPPTHHHVASTKAKTGASAKPGPNTTTPVAAPYTSAEFAKFCQSAHSYPAITLASTTPPSTMQHEFAAANTAIAGMEQYADTATKPLITSINATESQIAALLAKSGWSVTAIPSSQYPTLQTEAQTLNTDITRLNTETSKCSS